MKIGIIGIGNMSQAIIQSMPHKENITISARTHEDSLYKAEKLGVNAAQNHIKCVLESDVIILGVKPEVIPSILEEIAQYLEGKTIVSIAAKMPIDRLVGLAHTTQIIRVMPNLNVTIQKGVCAVCAHEDVSSEMVDSVCAIFEHMGSVVLIEERQMSGFIGIAGSSPAFVFKFIQALAQSALDEGIPFDQALEITCDAVSGSAQYLKVSGIDPQILIDRVCSPNGTTIEGVRSLDALNFDDIMHQSVQAVINKDKNS